jgi:putative hydrolase of the HAD superfamily
VSRRASAALEAVLFDATGTLIELRESVGEGYARVARRHGVDLPAWRIDDAWKRIVAGREPRCFPGAARADVPRLEREWWYRVVRGTFRAADQTAGFRDFDAFFDELFGWYATAEAWRLREGVLRTLERLRAGGLRLGVVSDFDYRLTDVLEALGIARFFETVTLAGACGATKPDARLFEAALHELGVPARRAVYVGDDPERDLAGARAAGLAALDVRSLAHFRELPERLATLSDPPQGSPDE